MQKTVGKEVERRKTCNCADGPVECQPSKVCRRGSSKRRTSVTLVSSSGKKEHMRVHREGTLVTPVHARNGEVMTRSPEGAVSEVAWHSTHKSDVDGLKSSSRSAAWAFGRFRGHGHIAREDACPGHAVPRSKGVDADTGLDASTDAAAGVRDSDKV